MRRVIIQICSIFFGLFFLISGLTALYYNISVAYFLILSGVIYAIVASKLMMFRTHTNMYYITLFLFLALMLNVFIIEKFEYLVNDRELSYVVLTLPGLLKDSYILISALMVFLSGTDFLNSGNID